MIDYVLTTSDGEQHEIPARSPDAAARLFRRFTPDRAIQIVSVVRDRPATAGRK